MEFPKNYDPKAWEATLYKQWEESGFFDPDVCVKKGIAKSDAESFSIVLPPPNVTGHLHMGHAAMLAIEDVLIRFHRMNGYKTLWLPGTDHAAIATQEKVERILFEKTKQTRHDLGREKFLKQVDDFAQKSHDRIIEQTKRMGSSLDWSREAFTLDKQRNLAVRTAFKKMYDDGIIYRGDRIVNWDPQLKTTVSDDEIEWKTETIPFYYFQYGPFVIGTSRPETKFGDKYVVMHPDDDRYKEYEHGQQFDLEWVNGKITATVIKDEVVDMEFGSGVMTITPWHDTTDFEISERHDLIKEQVIGYDGKMLPIAGKDFEGLEIFEARKKIVEALDAKGLLVKVDEKYTHNIAINSRGGGVIEPQIMRQWFVGVNNEFKKNGKTTTLKKLMQNAVRSGDIDIIPQRFEKTYFHWIDNLRDWCISRQLWYGHQIPVWYRGDEVHCDIKPPEGDDWTQDPDTLDTWFSAGLWTFSTLGWPEKTKDLKTFHPTSVLETGYDIIFFWVARMILMSTYILDEVPFEKTYLHGMVRDDQGRKMSKSLDNVIDPLDVSDQYGTDAVRLSLLIGSTPGNDLKLSEEKISSFRNFTNKLWNVGRYTLTQSASQEKAAGSDASIEIKTIADAWITERLNKTLLEVTKHLNTFNLSLAGETLRDFTWNEFADWYVEIHKIEKNDKLLRHVFETLLKLWHPFMPFVTEALWQEMHPKESMLMVSSWPKEIRSVTQAPTNSATTVQFEAIQDLIIKIRNIRSIYHIDPGQRLNMTIITQQEDLYASQKGIISKLARIDSLTITTEGSAPKHAACIHTETSKAYIHLDDILDIDAERKRLEDELSSLERYSKNIEGRLANKNYTQRAPRSVVEESKAHLLETKSKIDQIKTHINSLS